MNLRYDDDFLEAVVFVIASQRRSAAPLQHRRFHAERERCYDLLDPDERATAFFKLHLSWFREWGLEKLLLELLHEYPKLTPALDVLAFRKVRLKKDEGAELYVNAENQRHAVMGMRSERFESERAVRVFLRHEWMHLADMVDPAFEYTPEVNLPGLRPAQHRLARERYRLLWDITIDGRLHARGALAGATGREIRWVEFDRAFHFWAEARREAVFNSLWREQAPRHPQLLEMAAATREAGAAGPAVGGALCPLCGFPTFDWANPDELNPEISSAIEAEFPNWSKEDGVCARCVEAYTATLSLT